jgi:hypothetical protein
MTNDDDPFRKLSRLLLAELSAYAWALFDSWQDVEPVFRQRTLRRFRGKAEVHRAEAVGSLFLESRIKKLGLEREWAELLSEFGVEPRKLN